MFYDGPKRHGRFLRREDKILENVSLVDFTFEEITEASPLQRDNPTRTIVHTHYHDEEELSRAVKIPDKFSKDLEQADSKRPIIFPVDFTLDWERSRTMRRDRAQRLDDEDYDFEFEMNQRLAQEKARRDRGDETPEEGGAKANTNADAEQSQQPSSAPSSAPEAAPSQSRDPQTANAQAARTQVDAPAQALRILREEAADSAQESAAMSGAGPAAQNGEFIPLGVPKPSVVGEGPHGAPSALHAPDVRAAEADASRRYRERQELEQANKVTLEQLATEAKAQGYRDGFRAGEEKGALQAKQQALNMFAKVDELVAEFGGLKHLILDNVQENFYDIAQAVAEALLKREFSIRPETFVGVVRQAIAETVAPDKFKVRVHPDTLAKVMDVADGKDPTIVSALVRDPSMTPGDFKIESELSVVDVNIGKLVTELLAKADLELFGDDQQPVQDKAS